MEQIDYLFFSADMTPRDTPSSFYLYYITFNSTYPDFFPNYDEVQKYANKQLKIKTCVFCLILPN